MDYSGLVILMNIYGDTVDMNMKVFQFVTGHGFQLEDYINMPTFRLVWFDWIVLTH